MGTNIGYSIVALIVLLPLLKGSLCISFVRARLALIVLVLGMELGFTIFYLRWWCDPFPSNIFLCHANRRNSEFSKLGRFWFFIFL